VLLVYAGDGENKAAAKSFSVTIDAQMTQLCAYTEYECAVMFFTGYMFAGKGNLGTAPAPLINLPRHKMSVNY
jgi:hypothetical protein